MGLTRTSTGASLSRAEKQADRCRKTIALAGNPNVGKSTLFNQLTGMKQHTGNWSGKTVTNAKGSCSHQGNEYTLIDIPGCYSLAPRSAEEEVARDLLCSETADAVIVVCAASCLERGMNLVLQILALTDRVVVCVNLMDEARRKGIKLDLKALGERLGVPVIGTCARGGKGLDELMDAVEKVTDWRYETKAYRVSYPAYIEAAVRWIKPEFKNRTERAAAHASLELLADDSASDDSIIKDIAEQAALRRTKEAKARIFSQGITQKQLSDDIASATVKAAAEICRGITSGSSSGYSRTDRKLDKLLTGKWTAYPIMLLMLLVIFWITLTGANYPSEMLRTFFSWAELKLELLLGMISCPAIISNMLVHGIFRILGWVVSVMLPPMAIFFPLFTILEDSGFLPRLAFNMDHSFKRCGACGKQALTIAMGFGCNAAGITGCRIIDSPRERLIAVLTNSFVPCNGRFPMIAAIIAMFLTAGLTGAAASAASAFLLAAAVVLSIAVTFAASKLLSRTLLKGVPSSFILELPPYRMPQWGKVIVRSIFDRTLFVLGRAVMTAAPAGLILWLMANIGISGESLLTICSSALDAPGRLMGLDGAILLAFILGFPANEIVIPIILMIYTAQGELTDAYALDQMYQLLIDNGWTWATGVCVILFSLMHWPCSTTCLTIYKETRSLRWTAAAILLPTAFGFLSCTLFSFIFRLFC